MEKRNQNKLSIYLMCGSLLLLLLFLLFWLQKVYQDEYAALEKETNFIFTTAIREVEDSFLNKFLLDPLIESVGDSTSFTFQTNHEHPDTCDTFGTRKIVLNKINHAQINIDTSRGLTIRKKVDSSGGGLSSSISLFVELNDDSGSPRFSERLIRSPLTSAVDDTLLVALLDNKFDEAIKETDIHLNYQIIEFDDQDTIHQFWHSNAYKDLYSETSYAVSYDNYRPYIFKKILPHILFSIFLFSCISLAFFMVYQNLQKQRRLTELKNDFISNITHELKTPITTVGVAIEALSSFNALNDPNKTKEYLQISKYELDRLSILVDKVLKMSLFEKAEPELKLETFDLGTLIGEVLNSMKIQFEKLSAKVSFDLIGKNFSIEADRIHLTSVVFNLIDNALKYSPNNPQLSLTLENQEGFLKMSIADKGIGIAPEHQGKIFDKFFRVPSGDKHNIKGYGLGLSYVASVIKKHKGIIDVNSQPEEGTQFMITLPQQYEED